MISHLSIRKNNSFEILLDSFQYIFFKYQLLRIFKNSQLKLFDFNIYIVLCEKSEWEKHLKT